MNTYAGTKAADEALRHAIDGWAKSNGVRRSKGLPAALDRFIAGRVAKPIATTPAHLVPKFLRDLTTPKS